MNKETAYLIGAYLGDGHIYYQKTSRGTSHQFSITSEDRDFCLICSNIVENQYGKKGRISKVDNYYKLVVCDKEVCNAVLKLTCSNPNYYEATKYEKKSHIPKLQPSEEKEFIIGLMDADGWVRETVNGKYMKYEVGFKNTASWTKQIYQIIRETGTKCSKIYSVANALSWTITPKDYIKHFGFRIKRKTQLLQRYKENRSRNSIKRGSVVIRLTKSEKTALEKKGQILGKSVSALLRNGAWLYWDDGKIDAKKILTSYQNGSDNDKRDIVELVFKYYRETGYPYHKMPHSKLDREMQKLSVTKSPQLPENHLQMNTVGVGMCNYFHPHMFNVRCRDRYYSPYELFSNDELFRDAIKRWLDLGKYVNHAGIRRILRTRNGVRSVVNFKPAISKYFYDNYCPKEGKVLDPCAGFGGRLAGCIASNRGLHYHGIDPDGKTATGNIKLASHYSRKYDSFGNRDWNFRYTFDLGCAEDVMSQLNQKYDLIFTSPPFFDIEKYSTEQNQSYLRYPTYEEWKVGFLEKLVQWSSQLLLDNGHLIINIRDYSEMPLATDLCNFAEKYGLNLIRTHQMRLSNSEYNIKQGETWHTEPIFVFQQKI